MANHEGQFKKGKSGNPKGRPKGLENKTTRAVREVIARFADEHAGDFTNWIMQTAGDDPAKAAELYLKAIEYHIPKLARTEQQQLDGKGKPTDPPKINMTFVGEVSDGDKS